MADFPRGVRLGDVDDAQPVGEPGDRDLGAGHFLARLVAAGRVRLLFGRDAFDLEARERPPDVARR